MDQPFGSRSNDRDLVKRALANLSKALLFFFVFEEPNTSIKHKKGLHHAREINRAHILLVKE